MSDRLVPGRFTSHPHRLVHWGGLLLIVAVLLRRRYDLEPGYPWQAALALLGVFTLLYLTVGLLTRKFPHYPRFYIPVQVLLAQVLGIFQSAQDTWALMYIVLGIHVAWRCSRRQAWSWYAVMVASLLVTNCLEFGWISGIGRALAYIMIGTLIISFDHQYSQHEQALEESQLLLSELQEANRKLVELADGAEKLAAIRERDRMVQELYDSVGQKIFAIQLSAETTRLLLQKDPQRAADLVTALADQVRAVLAQMRQLIGQWRPH